MEIVPIESAYPGFGELVVSIFHNSLHVELLLSCFANDGILIIARALTYHHM